MGAITGVKDVWCLWRYYLGFLGISRKSSKIDYVRLGAVIV